MQLNVPIPVGALAITRAYSLSTLAGALDAALRRAAEHRLARAISASAPQWHMNVPAHRELDPLREQHQISIAEKHQFRGANVAREALAAPVFEARPALLRLSASTDSQLPALREALAAVRVLKPDLPVALGGGRLQSSPALARKLGVQTFAREADELAGARAELRGCNYHDQASAR